MAHGLCAQRLALADGLFNRGGMNVADDDDRAFFGKFA